MEGRERSAETRQRLFLGSRVGGVTPFLPLQVGHLRLNLNSSASHRPPLSCHQSVSTSVSYSPTTPRFCIIFNAWGNKGRISSRRHSARLDPHKFFPWYVPRHLFLENFPLGSRHPSPQHNSNIEWRQHSTTELISTTLAETISVRVLSQELGAGPLHHQSACSASPI